MKITAKHLFEIAGIPVPYILLVEGYKEATAEFSAISPDAPAKIEAFRALVNKNQATGDERNIDYWRKQGWEAFVAFINSKSGPTKTQLKRKKVVGQSITLREDDEWLIVIPLDKDASCFHGKNSDWCTTKYNETYFEQYFYDNEVVLVYCLNKQNSGMWALAGHKRAKGKLEIFDQRDKSINAAELKAQTGLNAAELVELALAQSDPIDKSRSDYMVAKANVTAKLKVLPNRVRDEELERAIVTHKFEELAVRYLKGNREAGEEVQVLAVKLNGLSIAYIKNPSEKLQRLAIQQSGWAIMHIKNPSEELKKMAVQRVGFAIEHIKNPSDEVQRLAVQNNGNAIQYIENPSEELKELAVRKSGNAIRYIKNPSEELKKMAVQQNGYAIMYFKNPSEELKKMAVQGEANAIEHIKNPSEELQRLAVQQTGDSIRYLNDPSEAVQKLAVQQTGYALRYIENPTPAVVALHNKLWGSK